MTTEGYIYILLRGDFIEKRRYIYKIGETTRYPPHRRLWEYPYGSVFLSLIKTLNPTKFEKQLKSRLSQSSRVVCVKDIGIEYYEGSLQEIIDIITAIYPTYNTPSKIEHVAITEDYLLQLNHIHYIVNYDEEYFKHLTQQRICCVAELIPSEKIYETYAKFRSWHAEGFPENYVIRCGFLPIKPNKKMIYHSK